MSKFDPRDYLGPEDGVVTNAEGKRVGFFWENPITKGMTQEERDEYWKKQEEEERWAMNGIGWAVKQMQDGRRVCRAGWDGKNMWLELQVPDAHSKMSHPYVYLRTADGKLVPWTCSQTDLLAIDWEVVA